MKFTNTATLSILITLVCCAQINAQNISTSPYNRFGIGSLLDPSSAHIDALGGSSAAFTDPDQLNLINPAALSQLKNKKVIIETSALGSITNYRSQVLNTSEGIAQFGYLALGMNVAKKSSVLFSLQRMNNANYEFKESAIVPGVGGVNYNYSGKGSFNSVNLSFQRDLSKKLSFGITGIYNFGSIRSFSQSILADSIGGFNAFANRSIRMNDVNVRIGATYLHRFHSKSYLYDRYTSDLNSSSSKRARKAAAKKAEVELLKKEFDQLAQKKQAVWSSKKDSANYQRLRRKLEVKDSVLFSISGVFEPSLNAKSYESFYAYTINSGEVPILNYEDRPDRVVLPSIARLGFSLGSNSNSWKLIADLRYYQFSNFKKLGLSDSVQNSYQLGLGMQWIPNAKTQTNYLKHIVYRAGTSFNSGYINLRNQSISTIGFSVGMGIPFSRPRYSNNKAQKPVSMINIAATMGQTGTLSNSLIRERFFRVSLSFSLTDDWFQRRQYD